MTNPRATPAELAASSAGKDAALNAANEMLWQIVVGNTYATDDYLRRLHHIREAVKA